MILCIYYIFNDRIAEQLNIFFWKECRRRVKQWFSSNTCYYFNVPGNISSRKFDFYETMSCASSDMRVDKYTMKEIAFSFVDMFLNTLTFEICLILLNILNLELIALDSNGKLWNYKEFATIPNSIILASIFNTSS